MKFLHQFDAKGRLRLDDVMKSVGLSGGKKTIFFSKDHFTVFGEESYEKFIETMSGLLKLDKYTFTVIMNGESIVYAPDAHGRLLIPKTYREEAFKEKDVYAVPLEYEGMKIVEVYPKSVYENKIKNIIKKDKKVKGKEDEKGRRKD